MTESKVRVADWSQPYKLGFLTLILIFAVFYLVPWMEDVRETLKDIKNNCHVSQETR